MPSHGRKNSPGITRYRWSNARARRDDKFVVVERLRRIVKGQRALMRHLIGPRLARVADAVCRQRTKSGAARRSGSLA